MNRLMAWPHHRLTLAIAVCLGLITAMNAAERDFGWPFWSGVVIVAWLIVVALKEKRRGD